MQSRLTGRPKRNPKPYLDGKSEFCSFSGGVYGLFSRLFTVLFGVFWYAWCMHALNIWELNVLKLRLSNRHAHTTPTHKCIFRRRRRCGTLPAHIFVERPNITVTKNVKMAMTCGYQIPSWAAINLRCEQTMKYSHVKCATCIRPVWPVHAHTHTHRA